MTEAVLDEPKTQPSTEEPSDGSRMSFGDHLEELRSSLIRALLGVLLTTIVCLVFGTEILEILCRPLFAAQHANGLPPLLQALAPTAVFVAYLKVGFLGGLVAAMPWVIYQAWRFVQSGLYGTEQRFVRFLVPASFGLFATGVLFLYFLVLPLVFNFFIKFNQGFDVPAFAVVAEAPTDAPIKGSVPLKLPVYHSDATDTRLGDMWVDGRTNRVVVDTGNGHWYMTLTRTTAASSMQSQFAIDYYVSFVLLLALAFGIAFETPIVVFFLSWTGIVSTTVMAQGRRYVVLAVILLAAILTPPDIISQMLLAIPMYLLFELGLLAARLADRKTSAAG
ncbi:MAG: twin-arginine translocase subunit TatC [Planctomycetes bacterium]|nr:twin-arginine translocase subunit TatC [Planctomycetota bacterium]